MSMSKKEAGKLGALKYIENLKERKIIDEYNYYLSPVICKHCGNPHIYEKRKNKFCSISCATTFNNLLKNKNSFNCLNCNAEIIDEKSKYRKYCSIKGQNIFQIKEKIKENKASPRTLKKYLLEVNGNKCWDCGISEWNNKSITMDLEHIDGNSDNNTLENLSLLCPNCHSQTPTYKGANKGNGRHSRRIRYAEGKSY